MHSCTTIVLSDVPVAVARPPDRHTRSVRVGRRASGILPEAVAATTTGTEEQEESKEE